MKKHLYVLLSALALVSCGSGGEGVVIPPQRWKDMDVRVESHPNPPVVGMSEFVVIVTGPHGRPAGDMIVSMRGDDGMPWVQAIQDGRIGVYRRAVELLDSKQPILQINLKQGEEQNTLLFPLKLAAE